jgi:hypothetical protein
LRWPLVSVGGAINSRQWQIDLLRHLDDLCGGIAAVPATHQLFFD